MKGIVPKTYLDEVRILLPEQNVCAIHCAYFDYESKDRLIIIFYNHLCLITSSRQAQVLNRRYRYSQICLNGSLFAKIENDA